VIAPGVFETVLVAPATFTATMTGVQVADAIARGLESVGVPVDRCPVADGGEGTLEVLIQALDAQLESAHVSDPVGRPIEVPFALIEEGRGRVGAIVETATAIGLPLLAPGELDPIGASSAGAGELILAAVRAGASVIHVAVGGSATTDGGAGAIEAIRRGGGLGESRLVVLCDVRTPFEEAARVYGPQKGARDEDVRRLTQRLHRLARRLERDPRGRLMTGAAGGLSGGLWGAFGSELVPGAAWVLDRLNFDRRMRAARAVVGGEGRLDQQSLSGKALSEVATRARQAGVPCHAIVGQRALDAFGARILDLQAVLAAGTLRRIETAARRLAAVI
jgi:glycerate 2-kinase